MSDVRQALVVNTTPLITLSVATGSLEILKKFYSTVVVPYEVCQEMLAGGETAPGARQFIEAGWMDKRNQPQDISPYLRNTLDLGEASVIQIAITEGVEKVCIDEKVGRRVARLNGLTVVGSIGILAKAIQLEEPLNAEEIIARLKGHGIWLSKEVEQFLLNVPAK